MCSSKLYHTCYHTGFTTLGLEVFAGLCSKPAEQLQEIRNAFFKSELHCPFFWRNLRFLTYGVHTRKYALLLHRRGSSLLPEGLLQPEHFLYMILSPISLCSMLSNLSNDNMASALSLNCDDLKKNERLRKYICNCLMIQQLLWGRI